MMNKFWLIAAVLLVSGAATAAEEPAQPAAQTITTAAAEAAPQQSSDPKDIAEDIRVQLMSKLGTKVTSVEPTAIPNLYEAVVGHEIIYVDEGAKHLIMGQMFDTDTKRNLTQEAQERLMRIKFNELPFNDAIKTVIGDGSRKIAVFSDPNCSFCKKLEANLRDMKNVTIYTFLYPVITPTSKNVSANIWCAKDASAAWKGAMLEGKTAPQRDEKCDISALDRNIELGARLRIDGTPTVFTPSGARAPGAASVDYIEKLLNEK